jgi:thiamine biosynthesis protein ThiI
MPGVNDRAILLRYHEVALKGGNRAWFEKQLADNARKIIRRSATDPLAVKVRRENSRLVVKAPWTASTRQALGQVFGVTGFSRMRIVPTDCEALVKACVEEFAEQIRLSGLPPTFRVRTRRSEKALPESSHELDRLIGAAILERFPGLKVQLKDPAAAVSVEIRRNHSYVWTEKARGAGGLPVGTNGRLLALMSGGLDSPVAAVRALRRGSPLSFVHFYGAPFVGHEVLDKISDLVRVVNRYQPDPAPLHIVHFGKIQEKIALATHARYRTLLYRRMMIRVADEIARQVKAKGLVTGESLGQVASQTLENLGVINSVARLPILRPLVSFDKDEIIEEAHRLGTFEISVRPATDCCTLFTDQSPVTRARASAIAGEEERLSIDALLQEALANTEIRVIS